MWFRNVSIYRKFLITIILVGGFNSIDTYAAIYKCKNTDGNIEFRGTPCKGQEIDQINDSGQGKAHTQRITTRIMPERVRATVIANGISMQVEDVVAVFFISKNKLIVFFSPRSLEPEEIEKLKQDKSEIFVLGKPSPDPLLWKEFPSTVLDVYFKLGQIPAIESVSNFDYRLTNLTQPPKQDSNSIRGHNAGTHFQKFILNMNKNNGILELEYADNKKIADNSYQWKIDVKLPVHIVQ